VKDFPSKINTIEKIFLLKVDGENTMAALERTGGKNLALKWLSGLDRFEEAV